MVAANAEGSNMENVRQIYQALLLLQLEADTDGYNKPEALIAIAKKVRWLVLLKRSRPGLHLAVIYRRLLVHMLCHWSGQSALRILVWLAELQLDPMRRAGRNRWPPPASHACTATSRRCWRPWACSMRMRVSLMISCSRLISC